MKSVWITGLCVLLAALGGFAEGSGAKEEFVLEKGFVSLFDGKTLNGWKMTEEKPDGFHVEDGVLITDDGRCHLFYAGEVANHDFKNFELKLDVMTSKKSNSGVYFHTEYLKEGWPSKGHECQVNTTHGDWRKTGSLYNVENLKEQFSKDGKWFTYHIIVKGKRVQIKVDGKTILDYTEPADVDGDRRIDHGTFALQGHDPESVTRYKNIRVKVLED
jgi:hypothetical protein